MSNLVIQKFSEIDLSDPFFESLKSDYAEFETWFRRKGQEEAFLLYEGKKIEGFLYLKYESGPIIDVEPPIYCNRALKVGTLKIRPHGTRLGERFIKKALDFAIINKVDLCYVTVFEKHQTLLDLFEKYGFVRQSTKTSSNGTELVLVKNLKALRNDILLDYPLINTREVNKFLLSVYPQYHSNLFPDSLLRTESVDILEDISHTNSIHKIYVCRMKDVAQIKRGDALVIYRTKNEGKTAEYNSVVTSVCIAEEVKKQTEFRDFEDFFDYANVYSVFDRKDLRYWYEKGGCYTIKMTYNAALSKRLIRKKLIEEMGLERDHYWGFFQLTDEQFYKILEAGAVHEGIIID